MKKTLSSIRITDAIKTNMEMALKKLNEKSLVQMSINDFRRLCYVYFSKLVLQNKELPFELKI